MTTAAIYVRQSLDKAKEGLAVDRQLADCQAYVQAKGWTVGTVYSDNDISATTGKRRPAFEALLAAETVVVVWHQDRLLRVSRDLERVVEAGLTVHAVQAGTLDLATPTGKAMARTITAWSTYEGEHKAARQRSAAQQRAASGKHWWPVAPFGYLKDGTLSPDAPLVKAAYEDVLAGVSVAQITRTWNAAGALTPRKGTWIRTSVLQVLKAHRNAGLRTYQTEVVGKGDWTPIVDEGTFYAVQAVLADPARGKGGGARANLLSGIARCGTCGRGMVSATYGQVGYRYKAYRCPTGHLSVKAAWLEDLVTTAARAPERPQNASGVPRYRHLALSPTAQALSDVAQALRDRLDEVSAAFAAGAIPMQVLTTATADIQRRLADNLAAMMAEVQTPHYDTGKALADMSPDEAHAHLKATFEIVVQPIGRTKRTPDSVTIEGRGLSH